MKCRTLFNLWAVKTVAILALVAGSASFAWGQTANTVQIVRIEEEWELTVGQPNLATNAPQVSMVMSPHSSSTSEHFVFELNFKTQPEYTPGGMQVQYWTSWGTTESRNGGPSTQMQLHATNDTVTWRQAMTLDQGNLRFEIENGNSASWGAFGGQGYLRLDVTTALPNLNYYSARVSLDESGISYAGNRVDSLKLTKIKWIASDGQSWELVAPFDIDSDLDPWDD